MIYYPIEKMLAHMTDSIITINQEDYCRASQLKLKGKGTVYSVPGVGIDVSQYHPSKEIREKKRIELDLEPTDIAVISAGDLVKRKNYKVSIEAIEKTQNKKIHYFICGEGPLFNELKEQANRGSCGDRIHFLGYRTDVKELLQAADVFLFTTLQEGLPRSLMEAMASGLPCVASNIRGNIDLIENRTNGYLVDANDSELFARYIDELADNSKSRIAMGEANIKKMSGYNIEAAEKAIEEVYKAEIIDKFVD